MSTLQGKYKVPHFDGKGEADGFFVESGLPVTYPRTSFYWDNFIYFGMGHLKCLTYPGRIMNLSEMETEVQN